MVFLLTTEIKLKAKDRQGRNKVVVVVVVF